MKNKILVFPGLGGSGPAHWQTIWEQNHPEFVRIKQKDWDNPFPKDWSSVLEDYVKASGPETIIVAHSLACAALVNWAQNTPLKISAALLVAPADVERKDLPAEAQRFAPISLHRLRFDSIVVASGNDPFVSIERARFFAQHWRSSFINIGSKGHINSDSGLGEWEEGMKLLKELMK
jgi:predicted alpha/beta hydrolase family esterase